ncbi:hypothetical protein BT96DRAFT_955205 [Gymnopus androsaceus JB14]|uniref:Uncharacterized protein n=1 Tax=Gymnopus androsaceus JB14 TaxID=1447944 RepID=A0A6A4I8X2_9AGAR|nr:hypothetical protein BT96DRAFT_955205 [Gymnopus androsaceus JB14]
MTVALYGTMMVALFVVKGAREAEQQREAEFQDKERLREDEFRSNEEDRQRIFRENEEARAREAAEARDAMLQDFPEGLGTAPVPPGGSVSGVPGVGGDGGDRASLHTIQDIRDTASRQSREIRDIIDMEREESAREREAATAERVRLEAERDAAVQAAQELKDSRIQELEEQVASLRAELEAEKQSRQAEESDARERERAEREENNDFIRNQLMDLTNLMNEQRQATDEKRELMESLFDEFQIERDRAEALRLEAEGKPGVEKILEEVIRRHDDIQESLRAFSDTWRNECEQHHAEIISAVRETANEQIPYNVQGYLDEFSKALASEVRMLLGEVGKLREERRALQHEIGYLLCMRSKYGPGGEFEPDWKPAPGAPGGPPLDPPPPPEPPVAPEIPPARPGWRSVTQRTRKKKKETAPPPPGPNVPTITGMDPRTQVTRSWATWQPDLVFQLTPTWRQLLHLLSLRYSSPRDSRI